MEIVTDFPPDITNEEEAKEYLVQLRQILVWLGVCDGKMEEGSLRCEPNISIRLEGAEQLGTKSELKNLNSFRAVQLGVQFEIRRQTAVLDSGGTVLQETRGWNEGTESSFAMRIKETENDYRYFPDPDLVPMKFEEADIEAMRAALPELPLAKSIRYQQDMGLGAKDAERLLQDREWAEFFEEAVANGGDPKGVCNLMISEFARMLNEEGLTPRQSRIEPAHLVQLAKLLSENTINSKGGKEVFAEAYATGKMPDAIVDERGLRQIDDRAAIEQCVREALAANPDVVEKYRGGQVGVAGFLVGQVMKMGQGRFNPPMVQEILKKELEG
jgi:aspartyl-tRNA(Asn)/glutamyl-tRNA(Gln) amidotransferase subunit B